MDKEKILAEWDKKIKTFTEQIEKDPSLMVCKLHKATNEEVNILREEKIWRVMARATFDGRCKNQICGWFLCIVAGLDKVPWED